MQSDVIPDKYRNRVIKCPSCKVLCKVLSGERVGGMPGIYYNVCDNCGWHRAITFKAPKQRL